MSYLKLDYDDFFFFFFFNDTATTEIYTLSLHDALPIWLEPGARGFGGRIWCAPRALFGSCPRPQPPGPRPRSSPALRYLHRVSSRPGRQHRRPTFRPRARAVRRRDASAFRRWRAGAALAPAPDARLCPRRARCDRGAARAARARRVRNRAVLRPQHRRPHGAESPPTFRGGAVPAGARRRSRRRAVWRVAEPARTIRRDVCVSCRHQGRADARCRRDAPAHRPPAQRHASRARCARPAIHGAATQGRIGTSVWSFDILKDALGRTLSLRTVFAEPRL